MNPFACVMNQLMVERPQRGRTGRRKDPELHRRIEVLSRTKTIKQVAEELGVSRSMVITVRRANREAA